MFHSSQLPEGRRVARVSARRRDDVRATCGGVALVEGGTGRDGHFRVAETLSYARTQRLHGLCNMIQGESAPEEVHIRVVEVDGKTMYEAGKLRPRRFHRRERAQLQHEYDQVFGSMRRPLFATSAPKMVDVSRREQAANILTSLPYMAAAWHFRDSDRRFACTLGFCGAMACVYHTSAVPKWKNIFRRLDYMAVGATSMVRDGPGCAATVRFSEQHALPRPLCAFEAYLLLFVLS
eukprot:scaffold133_cov407-Prasinococcus_capsulatus_cf.AAC.19